MGDPGSIPLPPTGFEQGSLTPQVSALPAGLWESPGGLPQAVLYKLMALSQGVWTQGLPPAGRCLTITERVTLTLLGPVTGINASAVLPPHGYELYRWVPPAILHGARRRHRRSLGCRGGPEQRWAPPCGPDLGTSLQGGGASHPPLVSLQGASGSLPRGLACGPVLTAHRSPGAARGAHVAGTFLGLPASSRPRHSALCC